MKREFEESKAVKILQTIGIITSILFIVLFFTGIMLEYIILLISSLCMILIMFITVITTSLLSNKDNYTSEFIKRTEQKLQKCATLAELQELEEWFVLQAVEDNFYRLSYPVDLKRLHLIIISKIEILEKQTK